MGAASFVAGDWGTSHLRLFLCDEYGTMLDSCSGPGAAELHGPDAARRFAATFATLTAGWKDRYGTLPAVLCGMVGSSIGWTQAPYVACPTAPEQIADACISLLQGRVHIVPGLSCNNRFNAPDFLRGEETQILGAMNLAANLRRGTCLLCLPGTHTKWAVLEDGRVREFLTAPTGELFAVLRDHSVLVRKPQSAGDAIDARTFARGLAHFNEFPQAQLLHRLFECRSLQLNGELSAETADAYLSGLLVASDVHGALRLLSPSVASRSVYLVGATQLTQLYALGVRAQDFEAVQLDGSQAVLAGLVQVHTRLLHKAAHAS